VHGQARYAVADSCRRVLRYSIRSAPLCGPHLCPHALYFSIPTPIGWAKDRIAIRRRPLPHGAYIGRTAPQALGDHCIG
jgi:hypothetical protein